MQYYPVVGLTAVASWWLSKIAAERTHTAVVERSGENGVKQLKIGASAPKMCAFPHLYTVLNCIER